MNERWHDSYGLQIQKYHNLRSSRQIWLVLLIDIDSMHHKSRLEVGGHAGGHI